MWQRLQPLWREGPARQNPRTAPPFRRLRQCSSLVTRAVASTDRRPCFRTPACEAPPLPAQNSLGRECGRALQDPHSRSALRRTIHPEGRAAGFPHSTPLPPSPAFLRAPLGRTDSLAPDRTKRPRGRLAHTRVGIARKQTNKRTLRAWTCHHA